MQLDLFTQTAATLAATKPKAVSRPEADRVREPAVAYLMRAHNIATLPTLTVEQPETVACYWHDNIATRPEFDSAKEHLVVFGVNSKHRLIGVSIVSVGTINECLARPADIFRPLFAMAAFRFLLAHNHPSGDATPSSADFQLSKRMDECGSMLGLKMIDHVIVGHPCHSTRPFYSHRAHGII